MPERRAHNAPRWESEGRSPRRAGWVSVEGDAELGQISLADTRSYTLLYPEAEGSGAVAPTIEGVVPCAAFATARHELLDQLNICYDTAVLQVNRSLLLSVQCNSLL